MSAATPPRPQPSTSSAKTTLLNPPHPAGRCTKQKMFSKSMIALALVALSSMSFVQADMLQISNPTQGQTWKVGETVFLQWTGNCASMGSVAKAVDVNLMTGEPTALRFVARLATIDCSGGNSRKEFTITSDVVKSSGTFSLSVQTMPKLSYSNLFKIDASSGGSDSIPVGAPSANNTSPVTNGTTIGSGSNGSTSEQSGAVAKTTTSMAAVALAAAFVAAQLL
ncbi:hypothetical protein BGW38_006013 [Lunasporangiospora selenospora]|uniref:Yeast cell wall synthesis Kre9/Knh1-like N-terminal domain-containing protein n=1 Tax=Lunasporangiospora selenospora TaxID=979761 RepID=A0A9P6KGY7_9FUNG|nr:hypothetical protein BGW38_006013 [Lunasporangiospora selenospora]